MILTGESRYHSDPEYIAKAVKIAKEYFSTIGIEVYPLETEEYRLLQEAGADFVSVYQETYNTEKIRPGTYQRTEKRFAYRFQAQERAILGGMRGVNFGALLGLDDFRKDAFAAGLHAMFLQKKYPHAEIGFSVPRLRPYKNNESNNAGGSTRDAIVASNAGISAVSSICRDLHFHQRKSGISGSCRWPGRYQNFRWRQHQRWRT